MKNHVAKAGFYCALVAFLASAGYGVVQVLQLTGVVAYPLGDRLIYAFSLAIAPPFLIAMLAFHEMLSAERRFWSHGAVLFAVLYGAYVILMYGVQLATVIPASLRDPRDTILTVRPHSFFWTLDALGYICMGISTLLAAFALDKQVKETKWLRRFLVANGWWCR